MPRTTSLLFWLRSDHTSLTNRVKNLQPSTLEKIQRTLGLDRSLWKTKNSRYVMPKWLLIASSLLLVGLRTKRRLLK